MPALFQLKENQQQQKWILGAVKEQEVAVLRKCSFPLFVCLEVPGSWLSPAASIASVTPWLKSRVPLAYGAAVAAAE